MLLVTAIVAQQQQTTAAAPGLNCDYNGNGVCDAADYVTWRNYLGTNPTGFMFNDSTPGRIDQSDYAVWKAGFGDMAGSGSLAIPVSGLALPEPTTAALLCGGALLMLGVRRR